MKRREFIKNTGILSLASVPVLSGFSTSFFNESKINVGIIGVGSRGGGLAGLVSRHKGFNLIGACDILKSRITNFKNQFPNAKVYKDYQELLNDKNIDAVVIATPLSTHYQIAFDSIDAGKHVYCEKTMTYDIEQAKKLVKKVESNNITFQTGHQYRSTPLYFRIAEAIQGGYIGELNSIISQWNNFTDWRRPVDLPENEKIINWRMYRESSKGLVSELLSHQIDFTNWILDDVPKYVQGQGGISYWKDGRETYDNVNCSFVYDKVKLHCSSTISNGYMGYNIVFKGTEGTIVGDMFQAKIFARRDLVEELGDVDGVSGATITKWSSGEGVPIVPTKGVVEGWEGTDYAFQQFEKSIRTGKMPPSNVYTGGNTAVCVSKAVDAMLTKETQYWKDSEKFI